MHNTSQYYGSKLSYRVSSNLTQPELHPAGSIGVEPQGGAGRQGAEAFDLGAHGQGLASHPRKNGASGTVELESLENPLGKTMENHRETIGTWRFTLWQCLTVCH